MSEQGTVSVLVCVTQRHSPLTELHYAYRSALEPKVNALEFVYVVDGDVPGVVGELQALIEAGEPVKVVRLAKRFGDATCLTAGFEYSRGEIILSLPAYHQVEASELPRMFESLKGFDMVVARRWPRIDPRFNRLQARILNQLMGWVGDSEFKDLGCEVRAFRRAVANEVPLYGGQHRFFPILAANRGFRVHELDVQQSAKDSYRRVYSPWTYPSHVLDILAVSFLIKFTKRPLRFFGMIGMAMLALGVGFLLYIIAERLFLGIPLGGRPALLLSSLIVVLGVQVFAMGLIGELIIFTHARQLREYTVAEVLNDDSRLFSASALGGVNEPAQQQSDCKEPVPTNSGEIRSAG